MLRNTLIYIDFVRDLNSTLVSSITSQLDGRKIVKMAAKSFLSLTSTFQGAHISSQMGLTMEILRLGAYVHFVPCRLCFGSYPAPARSTGAEYPPTLWGWDCRDSSCQGRFTLLVHVP